MPYVLLAIAFILNASASVLLKIGAQTGGVDIHNSAAVSGLSAFIISTLFYFLALRSIPLSLAYPIMIVMSFIIINTTAYFYLKESINGYQLVGYVLIIVGLLVIFYFSADRKNIAENDHLREEDIVVRN